MAKPDSNGPRAGVQHRPRSPAKPRQAGPRIAPGSGPGQASGAPSGVTKGGRRAVRGSEGEKARRPSIVAPAPEPGSSTALETRQGPGRLDPGSALRFVRGDKEEARRPLRQEGKAARPPRLSPRPPSRGPAPPSKPGKAPAGWTPDRRFAPSGVTKGGRRAVRSSEGGRRAVPRLSPRPPSRGPAPPLRPGNALATRQGPGRLRRGAPFRGGQGE